MPAKSILRQKIRVRVGNNYIYLLTLGPVKGSSRDHHNVYIVGVMVVEMLGVVSNFFLSLRGRLKLQSAKAAEEPPSASSCSSSS